MGTIRKSTVKLSHFESESVDTLELACSMDDSHAGVEFGNGNSRIQFFRISSGVHDSITIAMYGNFLILVFRFYFDYC